MRAVPRPTSAGAFLWILAVSAAGFAVLASIPRLQRRQAEVLRQEAPPEMHEAVVHLRSSRGFGSGFFIREDGLILTNAHVLGRAEEVAVIRADGQRLRGRVLERAVDGIDLALVKVDLPNAPVLPLTGHTTVRPGTTVYTIGFGPRGEREYAKGTVTRIFPLGTLRPIVESELALREGSSGAPLVDVEGRVVGIVTATIGSANEINFAIRADVALQGLKNLAAACDCIEITAPNQIQVYVDGKRAGRGPWLAIPAEHERYSVFAVIDGTLRRARIDYPGTRTVELTRPDGR